MSPKDLMKKTILAEATRSSTDFEEVMHRKVLRKAKIEYGDFRQVKKDTLDGKQIEDEISFLDMITPFVARGDDITYDGVTYNVEYFVPVVAGVFKVFAIKSIRLNSSKSVKVR
jgi:hypothetical protein